MEPPPTRWARPSSGCTAKQSAARGVTATIQEKARALARPRAALEIAEVLSERFLC